MKPAPLVPIAFIANIHGFLLFVPYLLLFVTAAYVTRRRRIGEIVPVRAGFSPSCETSSPLRV
jgi:hypothetical protein